MNTSHNPQLRLRPNGQKITGTLSIFTALSLFALPATSLAQQTNPEATDNNDAIAITVEGKAEQIGKFVISGEEINQAPSPSGTFLEALRAQSIIQFDLNSRNSSTAGDITPPRISILGSKYYENNFLIDGISSNNDINPSGFRNSTGDAPGVAPAGEASAIFINPDLIGSVTVYTSNVPVNYGGFTGGVIDASIRDPKNDGFHGSFLYRYTSDAWADQRFVEGVDPNYTTDPNQQPRFTKHTFNVSFEGPLSSHIAALLDYSEIRSIKPIWDTTSPAINYDNKDTNKNLLLKLATYGLDTIKASLTATYAPYESDGLIVSRRNSQYVLQGGGSTVTFDIEKIFSFATWTAKLNYSHSDVNRDASSNKQYSWRNSANNDYANWSNSTSAASIAVEGSMGYYDQKQDQYTIKSDLSFVTFGPEFFKNTFMVGGEASTARIRRATEGAELYMWNASSTVTETGPLNSNAAGEKENGVITGEQWLNRRTVYNPTEKNMTYTQAAFFVQDVIQIERLTLRPGLRLDYEDISDNTAISPRFLATIDTFKNGLLNIFAGAARYYNTRQIVSHEIYNNQGFRTETRTSWDAPWTVVNEASDSAARNIGNLDTPYSNAFNLGATLDVKSTIFQIEGNIRKYRDQIRSVRDPLGSSTSRIYTNSGKSDYKGLTLGISRNFDLGRAGRHALNANVTWQNTKSNSRQEDSFNEHDAGIYSTEWASLNGEIVPTDNLPANNFNSDFVFTAKIISSLFKNRLRIFNGLRFEKGGDGLFRSTTPATIGPDGQLVYLYTSRKYSDMLNWDISLQLDLIRYKSSAVTLLFEVDNVLNRHTLINSSYNEDKDTYTLGRQFHAGIQYSF